MSRAIWMQRSLWGKLQTPDTGYSCTQAMETVTLRVSALPATARIVTMIKKRRQRKMQNRAGDKNRITAFWIIFTIIACAIIVCVVIFNIMPAVLSKESKADEQPVEYVLTAQTGTGVIRKTYEITYQKAITMTYSGIKTVFECQNGTKITFHDGQTVIEDKNGNVVAVYTNAAMERKK